MRLSRALLAIGIPFALEACAGPFYGGLYDWHAGWREGRIKAIGDAAAFSLAPACRAGPGRPPLYAEVAWVHMRALDYRIVPLPDDSFQPGDAVYVNVDDCAAPLHHAAAQAR